MRIIDGGITAAKGFLAAGAHIGIKKIKKDLSLLYSEKPAVAAGMFTQNIVRAAPVVRNEQIIKNEKKVRAIVTISGNANACTGEQGLLDNQKMADVYAQMLQVSSEEVLTAATGIIGKQMPINIIEQGIQKITPQLKRDRQSAKEAAAGIITTDTFLKEVAVELEIGGKTVTIGGMAKGSGMIHPNMATMLAFITSDVCIKRELLDEMLKQSIQTTYNMVSVDGDTSTNDTVIVLANGMAGNVEITEKNTDYEAFQNALHTVNTKLAKDLVRDGEGATKFIEVNVTGAKTQQDAKIMAKSVVTSNLVKTAMYGQDANWGRVLCAMGYSVVNFDTKKVDIIYYSEKGSIDLMIEGSPIVFDEEKAAEILSEKEITVEIRIQEGNEKATAWGCDLSHEYVSINGDYRS